MRKGRPGRAPVRAEGGGGQGDLFGGGGVAPAPVAPAAVVAPAPVVAAVPAVAAPPVVPAPVVAEPPPQVAPPPAPAPKPQKVVLSVGELTRQIKGTLESGFPRVSVRGEVSGFRGANARGHLYFSLKDKDACIDTKIWASLASRMKFKLRDGLEVIVEGSVDLYEPQGRYSLIVQRIEPAGEGALALAFQQMKERLMAEGLFGDRRIRPQRPVPFLPRRIGVVTSITGAALRDFLRVLHARHPKMSVLVADARVQGDGAAQEIARGIARLAKTDVDVIVVTRGGGSIEDLWAFNEEAVARAIFNSPVPVVSAVGHEVDYTISDFVADYRAPTPSAAAERLAPVLKDLELHLATCESRLRKAVERRALESRQRLERLQAKLGDPRRVIGQKRLHLAALAERAARATRAKARAQRERQKALAERLSRQHPQARLGQNRQAITRLAQRLRAALDATVKTNASALQKQRMALAHLSPRTRVDRERRRLEQHLARLAELSRRRLANDERRLHGWAAKLDALSPLKVMRRGYSVTFKRDGSLVRGAADLKIGDEVAIRLAPGACETLTDCDEVDATVTAVRPGGRS